MHREDVVSSNVAFYSFDETSNMLEIGYLSGYLDEIRIYRYSDVSASVVNQLREALSKGMFVCYNIAFKYSYEFIGYETDSE